VKRSLALNYVNLNDILHFVLCRIQKTFLNCRSLRLLLTAYSLYKVFSVSATDATAFFSLSSQ